MEKTEEELLREIDELYCQHRQITDRLRDPRGVRRPGFAGSANRNAIRSRAFTRPAENIDAEDQPPAKRRILSAVVKLEDGASTEADSAFDESINKQSNGEATLRYAPIEGEMRQSETSHGIFSRTSNQRASKRDNDFENHAQIPRVLPKNDDPRLLNRNKRMLGQLLGTLEKFRKEDMALSVSEAHMQRTNALQRAEQKAREESERLKKQEREQIGEKRRRDLTLRARVAAKAEQKKLELLFIRWCEHQKRLSKFIRTKTEPAIYYMPNKALDEDMSAKEKELMEWKEARREEVSAYQAQIAEQYLANVEKEIERWENARARKEASQGVNLQETMDKELDTHRMEHGPKHRNIPGVNEDDDDVEDINVGEDDMDDVLGVDDAVRLHHSGKPDASLPID